MGRKLDMMSGLSPGLLRMGLTAASFREGGTDPDLREQLMMEAMRLEMAGRLSLTNLEGIGSSLQVELIPVMKSDSCMGVRGEKWDRGCEWFEKFADGGARLNEL